MNRNVEKIRKSNSENKKHLPLAFDFAVYLLGGDDRTHEEYRGKMAARAIWAGICGVLQACQPLHSVV